MMRLKSSSGQVKNHQLTQETQLRTYEICCTIAHGKVKDEDTHKVYKNPIAWKKEQVCVLYVVNRCLACAKNEPARNLWMN